MCDDPFMKYSEKLKIIEDPTSELDVLLWSNAANFPLLTYGRPEKEKRVGWWLFWRDPSTDEARWRLLFEEKGQRVMAEDAARQFLDDMFGN